MYLATSAGVFYRLDMSLIPANSGPATGPAVIVKTGNPSLQLSFSCDFSVLWAQNYENNQWLTVNTGAFGGKEGEKVEREQKKVFFQFQKGGDEKTHNFQLLLLLLLLNSHGRRHPALHAAHPGAAQGPARPGWRCVHLRVIWTFFLFFYYFFLAFFLSAFSKKAERNSSL